RITIFSYPTLAHLLLCYTRQSFNQHQYNPVAPQQSTGSTKRVHFKNFASEWCGAPPKYKQ
ncbi:hypothetical protein ACU05H_003015, partial [Escherichia coli]